MKPETILRLTNECDGWSILDPDRLQSLGLPEAEAESLTDIFESDFSRASSTLFVHGNRTNQLRGICALRLLRRLAEIAAADLSTVVAYGRGTQAEQFKAAIRAALELPA